MNYTPDWDKTAHSHGYITVYCPDHPNAWSTGYIYAHRIIMEEHIGRLLQRDEIVHHHNEHRSDNRIKNLELMTNAEHTRQHMSTGKTMVDLICPTCNIQFSRVRSTTHLTKGGTRTFCSRSCSGKFGSQNYWGARSVQNHTTH